MENKYKDVISLEDVNNGAVIELFKDEFQKLLDNLADEDTSWKAQREINVKLTVKLTSEERTSAVSQVQVTTKFAPPKPNEEVIHLESDGRHVSAFHRQKAEQKELDNIRDIERAR